MWQSDLANTKQKVLPVCHKPNHTNKGILQKLEELEKFRNYAFSSVKNGRLSLCYTATVLLFLLLLLFLILVLMQYLKCVFMFIIDYVIDCNVKFALYIFLLLLLFYLFPLFQFLYDITSSLMWIEINWINNIVTKSKMFTIYKPLSYWF